jgi:hypothetical protein
MLRLVSFCVIILCLAMFTGCKMCASHTDITGSPVANAVASDGMRAGSHYGGYSGGGYYMGGYQSTATPQQAYDSEFSNPSTGTRIIQTTQRPSSSHTTRGNVVSAHYSSSR